MKLQNLHCFVNGIYSKQIGGGDIYFANLVKNYPNLIIYGGLATSYFLRHNFEGSYTQYITDKKVAALDETTLWGQVKLFTDHAKRMLRTFKYLKNVQKDSIAYAMSDYWFDTIPLLLCKAHKKIFYLGMIAPKPSLFNLASWHYWLSQNISLWFFITEENGIVTYSHPSMKEFLLCKGFKEDRIVYLPNSFDLELCDSIPPRTKVYDIVWTGRIHPQKGIQDLCYVLSKIQLHIPNLKVLIIGAAGLEIAKLCPKIDITASGIVSESTKFELLKSSKIFISTSHYESFGIAVGEALLSGCEVVAYDLACYKPVYANAINYIPCFDKSEFLRRVFWLLTNYKTLSQHFDMTHLSWTNTRKKFHTLLS